MNTPESNPTPVRSQSKEAAPCESALKQIAEKNPAGLSDEFVNAFRTGWRVAWAERDRELQRALDELPASFYADRDLPFRIRMMVVEWQRAINAYSEIDKSLSEAREERDRLRDEVRNLKDELKAASRGGMSWEQATSGDE